MLVHFVDCAIGVIGVLWLFKNAQKNQFLLPKFLNKSSSHKAFHSFLNQSHLLSFFRLFVVVKDFVAFLFFGDFFELFFLEVNSFKSSDNTLPSSFDFLYDSYSCLHVRVQGSSFLDNFLFREGSLLKIKKELLNDLVTLFFFRIFIVFEVPGDSHLNFRGTDAHFEKKLIEVDILRTYRVRGSVVTYEIEFDLDDSEHGGL